MNTTSTSSSSLLSGTANSTLQSEGQALCAPFAWADIGIMGGLWVLAFFVEVYFI
jgi:hypothetical protein